MDLLEAYKRAANVYNAGVDKTTLNQKVNEHWVEGSEDFWYAKDVEDEEKNIGVRYVRYNHSAQKEEPLFPHEEFASLIAPSFVEKADPFKLPIEVLEVEDEPGLVYFTIEGVAGEFTYDVKRRTVSLLRFALHEKSEVLSPNKEFSLYRQDHNLFCRNNKTGKVTQMTFDGEENLDYGLWLAMPSEKYLKDNPRIQKPGIVWSPDSKRFVTYRVDARPLGKLHLVQSAPRKGRVRPEGISYPYALPGDEHILEGQVYTGCVENMAVTKVLMDDEPVTLFLLAMFTGESEHVKWTEDGKLAYLVRYDRFSKTPQCIIIDSEKGTARVAREETYETFGFTDWFGTASQESFSDPGVRYLQKTEELLWLSEIDGWAALYLYDANTGELKRKLTDGEWVVRRIKHLDEENRTVYFTGGGLEPGVDPYYQFLYKVDLDTGELKKISQEIAEHYVRFSPKGSYYIDTFSTVQTVPQTVVRNLSGETLFHRHRRC